MEKGIRLFEENMSKFLPLTPEEVRQIKYAEPGQYKQALKAVRRGEVHKLRGELLQLAQGIRDLMKK